MWYPVIADGVFGGIIVGLGVAALHNRFYKIELPNALSFSVEQDLCLSFQQWHIFCRNLNVFLSGLLCRTESMHSAEW